MSRAADIMPRGNPGALFRNGTMDFLAEWLLGYAQQGGMSPGALLGVFSQISDGDPDSWSAAFDRAAGAALTRAEHAQASGSQYLAALESLACWQAHRACLAMMDPTSAGAPTRTRAMTSAFRAYLTSSDTPLEPWEITFGHGRLPAYWTKRAEDADRLAIIIGGGDTYAEDLWFFGGKALLAAGWSILLVDLPGQGSTPYQGLHFGADTLGAMFGVFDAIRERGFSGDTALVGWSGGGAFVTKYSSLARPEDRLRAVVASAPVHDLAGMMRKAVPAVMRRDPHSPLLRLATAVARRNRVLRCAIAKYEWQFGPDGVAAIVDRFADLGRTDLAAASVPILALVGANESAESQLQAEHVVATVRRRHPASALVRFDRASGGAAHCQVGNLPLALATSLHWLNQVLAND